MSHIDITRDHHLSSKQVRDLLDHLAADLAEKYGATYEKTNTGLTYKGPGVEGVFEILEGAIRITANLGFLMRPMKGMFENQINAEIDKLLAEQKAQQASKPEKTEKADKPAKAEKATPKKKKG